MKEIRFIKRIQQNCLISTTYKMQNYNSGKPISETSLCFLEHFNNSN